MHKYCKAYKLRDLRQFSDWSESVKQEGLDLSDESICYLYDDFTVVQSPFQPEEPLFNAVTPAWQSFCENSLKFEIPQDLQYAYNEQGK